MKIIMGLFVFLFALSAFAKLNLDTEKSQIYWKGTKLFNSDNHVGTVKVKKGFIDVEKDKIIGGEIVIDMASIETTDKMSDDMKKKLVGHLKDDDFFAVDKHPTATFKIINIETVAGKKTPNKYEFEGDLTIRGKTKPAKIVMDVTKKDGMWIATGTLTFDRSQFDVKYNSKTVFPNLVKTAKDKVIDDKIEIKMALAAPLSKKK